MSGKNFVVTDGKGGRQLFANVANATNFLKAMASTGKTAVPATAADLLAAGAVDGQGKPVASFHVSAMDSDTDDTASADPTHLFAGTRSSTPGSRATAHTPAAPTPKRKDTSALSAAMHRTNASDAVATASRLRKVDNAAPAPATAKRSTLGAVMDGILGKAR